MKDIWQAKFEGTSVFFSVDEADVQAKLDEYLLKHPAAPKLYIPADTEFMGLEKGKHVINFEFGFATGFEMLSMPLQEISAMVIIPFLAASPGGPAQYSLVIGEYSPESLPGGVELEEISIAEDHLRIKNQGEYLEATLSVTSPCLEPDTLVRHKLDDDVVKSLVFGVDSLLESFECVSVQTGLAALCKMMDQIRPDVEKNNPNVCDTTIVKDEKICDASFEIEKISQGFRDMLVLGDGPINIIGAEKINGNYGMGLKYPCVE
ncbi:hypothetical protein BSL78_02009 [Apostichopus japonicus]|uniref:Uncharacterized protein n=1 Tax=Stichopus japonicus TaxID=307972 RepID=A0A2G8LLH6_STIJA|nr:hypothetical protein BSL78_02009 [Apostichopus japonicus]